MNQKYADQVFIDLPTNTPFYNVLLYTDNLETEIKAHVIDVKKFLNEHCNGHKLHYQYEYKNERTPSQYHYVRGIWQDGRMINIEKDEITLQD